MVASSPLRPCREGGIAKGRRHRQRHLPCGRVALGSSSDEQTLHQPGREIRSPSQPSPCGVSGAGGGEWGLLSPQRDDTRSAGGRKRKFLASFFTKGCDVAAWEAAPPHRPRTGPVLPPHPVCVCPPHAPSSPEPAGARRSPPADGGGESRLRTPDRFWGRPLGSAWERPDLGSRGAGSRGQPTPHHTPRAARGTLGTPKDQGGGGGLCAAGGAGIGVPGKPLLPPAQPCLRFPGGLKTRSAVDPQK